MGGSGLVWGGSELKDKQDGHYHMGKLVEGNIYFSQWFEGREVCVVIIYCFFLLADMVSLVQFPIQLKTLIPKAGNGCHLPFG